MINLLNNDAFSNLGTLDLLVDAAEMIVSNLIPDAERAAHYCEPQMSYESASRAIARYVTQAAADESTAIDAAAIRHDIDGDAMYKNITSGGRVDDDELWNELALNVAGRIAAIAAGADRWQMTPDTCLSCGAFVEWD